MSWQVGAGGQGEGGGLKSCRSKAQHFPAGHLRATAFERCWLLTGTRFWGGTGSSLLEVQLDKTLTSPGTTGLQVPSLVLCGQVPTAMALWPRAHWPLLAQTPPSSRSKIASREEMGVLLLQDVQDPLGGLVEVQIPGLPGTGLRCQVPRPGRALAMLTSCGLL